MSIALQNMKNLDTLISPHIETQCLGLLKNKNMTRSGRKRGVKWKSTIGIILVFLFSRGMHE